MPELSADDIAAFRASARAAFGVSNGSARVRALMATRHGWDPEDWARLTRDLDLPGLTLPDEYGGAGLTEWELGFVMEEAGYALACLPLFSTNALAVPLLQALADVDALADLGSRIASGAITAAVALAEGDGSWDLDRVEAVAHRSGTRWSVSGSKTHVVDGGTADVLLVVARIDGVPAVLAVEGDEGVSRTPLVTLDQTRKMARVDFQSAPASPVGIGDATQAIVRASAIARSLLAAEQVGGAQRCLDMTADYARTRFQFARPIGSFQAVKQRLADVLIHVESARSAAYTATRCAAGGDAGLELTSRVAALTATDAFEFASAQAIQLHGGIGFTWEHDAHLYFKRSKSSAALLGSEGSHIGHIAQAIETRVD